MSTAYYPQGMRAMPASGYNHKVNTIAATSIGKVNTVATANIGKINTVD